MSNTPAVSKQEYTPEMLEQMETSDLLKLYKKTGDQSLKWPLVLRYENLVKNVAFQIRGVYSDFAQMEDIISEGLITLVKAIDRYDPERDAKFETYVSKRIRGMVIDLMRKQDWVSRNVRRRSKEINKAVDDLTNELGRYPTETEVAQKLGVSEIRYRKDMANIALGEMLQLDALLDSEYGYQIGMPADGAHGQPEAALQEQELQQTLAEGIASLRENEQIVISLHYVENLKLKEIAQVMNLSEPRISQLHSRAIQKLQIHMKNYMQTDRKSGHQEEKKHV